MSWPWFKLGAWLALSFWVGKKIRPHWVFCFLAIFGTIQSLIGFWQFIAHKSIGWWFFGESTLSPLNRDVARIFIGGGRLLRAYGTFPHPNILAAFLVLSLLSFCYFIRRNFHSGRIIYYYFLIPPFFINWLGLLLTFSRAGWLVALTVITFFILLNYRDPNLIIVVVLIATFLVISFYPLIVERARVNVDNFSIQNRLSDYHYAWQKIKEKPLFGHGLTLAVGKRPVHNLYLTIWNEMGLIGLLIFLSFALWNLLAGGIRQSAKNSEEIKILKIMLLALLALGLFDHFLWTLRPGLAMFWLVAGLLTFNRSRS